MSLSPASSPVRSSSAHPRARAERRPAARTARMGRVRWMLRISYRLIASVVIVGGGVYALKTYAPQQWRWCMTTISATANTLMFSRDLVLEGAHLVNVRDIEVRVPTTRSNVWWRGNLTALASVINEHPLVKRASVTPCSWYSLTCFRVAIQERTPMYLLVPGATGAADRAWLVGEDGGFIAPALEGAENSPLAELTRSLIKVEGVLLNELSPDMVRARFVRASEVVRALKVGGGFSTRALAVSPQGEFTVWTDALEAPVLLGADVDLLSERVARLVRLLQEIPPSHRGRIERIDLSLDRMGVVAVKKEFLSAGAAGGRRRPTGEATSGRPQRRTEIPVKKGRAGSAR